jgi:hypothetical protein
LAVPGVESKQPGEGAENAELAVPGVESKQPGEGAEKQNWRFLVLMLKLQLLLLLR